MSSVRLPAASLILPEGTETDYVKAKELYLTRLSCGNYDCQNYAIDLGFTLGQPLSFPQSGDHSIIVTVTDFAGNESSLERKWTVRP